jgi:hypothetical protein
VPDGAGHCRGHRRQHCSKAARLAASAGRRGAARSIHSQKKI